MEIICYYDNAEIWPLIFISLLARRSLQIKFEKRDEDVLLKNELSMVSTLLTP